VPTLLRIFGVVPVKGFLGLVIGLIFDVMPGKASNLVLLIGVIEQSDTVIFIQLA